MVIIQRSNGRTKSVELEDPQHSDEHSATDFSHDDSLRDPYFVPDCDENDENKDNKLENGNIKKNKKKMGENPD